MFIDTNAAAGIYAVAFAVLHSMSVVIRVMVLNVEVLEALMNVLTLLLIPPRHSIVMYGMM